MTPSNPNSIHAFRTATAGMRVGLTSQRQCYGEKCRGQMRSIGQFTVGDDLCKICRRRAPVKVAAV